MRFSTAMQRQMGMIAIAIMLSTVGAVPLQAQTAATLSFRPHCEKPNPLECPPFSAKDPSTLATQTLQQGDVLDIDIILQNPGKQPVQRVRSWLSYDPQSIAVLDVTTAKDFSVPVPGEVSFDDATGTAKIGVTRQGNGASGSILVVARIRFQAKKAGVSTPISFNDIKPDSTGHTYAVTAGSTQSILSTTLPSLLVTIGGTATAPAASSAGTSVGTSSASTASAAASSVASSAAAGTTGAFSVLQVQNVRTTTKGTTLYVAWESLPAQSVQGYNVYYGTQIGRYIQRRSVSNASTLATIEGLPQGVTYYAAVRAVNAQNLESAFSKEVAVQIGNAATSTSPLASIPTGNTTPPKNPVKNGTSVPGESGPSTLIAILLLSSAGIGTLFAFRRQFAVATHHTKNHV